MTPEAPTGYTESSLPIPNLAGNCLLPEFGFGRSRLEERGAGGEPACQEPIHCCRVSVYSRS